MLNTSIHVGRDFTWYADLEQAIKEVTPEAILEAFRNRIDPEKITWVAAGDFTESAAGGD